MNLIEKSAYIKGLADGLDYNKETAEGKLIAALIDMTDLMAKRIEMLEDAVDELNDYIEEIDEDLGEVEEYLCEDDECDCGCGCGSDCDCGCQDGYECTCDDDCDCDCCCDCDCDEEYFEVECPSCGEVICFDESIDPEELICPACNEKFACIIEADDVSAVDGKDE